MTLEQYLETQPQNRRLVIQAAWEAGRRDALEEQWISVEEKLPELDRDVLVFCPDDTAGIFVDRRKKYRDERGRDDGDGWDAGDGSGVTVTHWQKLPEPPKAAAIRALK